MIDRIILSRSYCIHTKCNHERFYTAIITLLFMVMTTSINLVITLETVNYNVVALQFGSLMNLNNVQQQVGRVSAGKNTNFTISQLGCGTWSWGNRLLWEYDTSQDEEIYNAYEIVRNAGVTIFDTADSYGTLELNGRAEILLGQFEKRYQNALCSTSKSEWWNLGTNTVINKTNQQQVATKFAPYPWRITRGSIVQAAKDSLRRLEQDKLAIAQLHWSTSNYQPLQEGALWEGIADVYDAGLCDAVGVSNFGPQQLSKVAKRMNERNVPLAIAQVQYSLMTYGVGQYMNEACDDVGCRLISYSPLCLGLLTGKYNLDNLPRPGNPRRQLFRELLPGAQDLLRTLDAVANEYNKTPSQVAINWAICKGTVPIPGCRTISQASSNVDAAMKQFRLRADAITELDRVALAVKKPMIQNIFQTK
jgi:pyridoxine 4-dehydrogenase